MGYPMTYKRVVMRNYLTGEYESGPPPGMPYSLFPDWWKRQYGMICGDLRRLEKDQRDVAHLYRYAEIAGCEPAQVKRLLDAFFDGQI